MKTKLSMAREVGKKIKNHIVRKYTTPESERTETVICLTLVTYLCVCVCVCVLLIFRTFTAPLIHACTAFTNVMRPSLPWILLSTT